MPVTQGGCIYPTNAEWRQLQEDLIPLFDEGKRGMEILPFRSTDRNRILLGKPDNIRGMQSWRDLDNPTRNETSGYNYFGSVCEAMPGYWGENSLITERFLTEMGNVEGCGEPVDLGEVIAAWTRVLLERRYTRVEYAIWQALANGLYTAQDVSGQIVYQAQFAIRNFAVPVAWSDILNSRPLDDFRNIQLLSRGTSADFGIAARAFMNRETANALFRNQNPNDVGKAGLSACCTFMGIDIVNQQFAAQGLPQIEIYDNGYIDDFGNFHTYIPTGKVVIVGRRPGGVSLGNYVLTRNAAGCEIGTGFWSKIDDNCGRETPRRITLWDGHNGGVVVEYPNAIVVLDVGV